MTILCLPGINRAQDRGVQMVEDNWNRFGYPCPAPHPEEPGVQPFRRCLYDGDPCLNFCVRPQDEVWLISTRQLCGICCEAGAPQVGLWDGRCWQQQSPESFLVQTNSDTQRQTVIFVHGHRTDACWAIRRGTEAYQAIFGNCADAPPVRFAIWSWPSDPEPRIVKNFGDNCDRAVVDGKWLGSLLKKVESDARVGLMGYSLGTQVLFTALECVSQAPGNPNDGSGRQFDLSIVAPVTHCHWSHNSCRVERTYQMIRSMVVFKNSDDRALAAFEVYCKCQSRSCGCQLDSIDAFHDRSEKILQFDVASEVGPEHNFVHYVGATTVQAFSRDYLIGLGGGMIQCAIPDQLSLQAEESRQAEHRMPGGSEPRP